MFVMHSSLKEGHPQRPLTSYAEETLGRIWEGRVGMSSVFMLLLPSLIVGWVILHSVHFLLLVFYQVLSCSIQSQKKCCMSMNISKAMETSKKTNLDEKYSRLGL